MSKDNNDNDNDGFLPDFGDSDPKKYEEYLRQIYKDLTGEDLPNGDLDFIPLDDLRDMGDIGDKEFLQSLPSEESQEIFNQYIKDNNMNLEIEFSYSNNNLMVEEVWTQDNDSSVIIKRLYNYEDVLISKIDPDIKKSIYSKRLETLVDKEEYEKAAEVRDIINYLNEL